MKTFIYNFNGTTYETNDAFDATYRAMKKKAEINGEPFTRQVINGNQIINEKYFNGIWLPEM